MLFNFPPSLLLFISTLVVYTFPNKVFLLFLSLLHFIFKRLKRELDNVWLRTTTWVQKQIFSNASKILPSLRSGKLIFFFENIGTISTRKGKDHVSQPPAKMVFNWLLFVYVNKSFSNKQLAYWEVDGKWHFPIRVFSLVNLSKFCANIIKEVKV